MVGVGVGIRVRPRNVNQCFPTFFKIVPQANKTDTIQELHYIGDPNFDWSSNFPMKNIT